MKLDFPDPLEPIKTFTGLSTSFSTEAILLKPRIVRWSSVFESIKHNQYAIEGLPGTSNYVRRILDTNTCHFSSMVAQLEGDVNGATSHSNNGPASLDADFI